MTKPPSAPKTPPRATDGSAPSGGGGTGGPAGSGPLGGRRGPLAERARLGGAMKQKRSPRAAAVSVLMHLVVVVIVVQLLTFGHGISGFLDFGKEKLTEERLTYVATEPKAVPKSVATKPPVPTDSRRLTSPAEVPSAAPNQPVGSPQPARADTGSGAPKGGTGNGVGAIDPNLKGVKPSFGDPRVWQGPVGNGVAPGRDGAERLDSVMGHAILAARDSLDSLARAQGRYGKAPGDWTKTDKNGNKWGWDNAGIRLGKVVIPNALLSLLPLNAQVGMSGNYTAMERERRLSSSRADIQRMSERGQGEAEFRRIANDLRDRRESERRDRLRAPSAAVAPTAPVTNPPKSDKN